VITGAHVILHARDAHALRGALADAFGWPHVDAGDGWLIFALPPAELAVHPTEDEPKHELYLMCDDIDGTILDLRERGVDVRGTPADRGWGITAPLALPGDVAVTLYQPRHPIAAGG
jgi:hypothetical protein